MRKREINLDFANLISKYKTKLLELSIILLSLFIASNIYKWQARNIILLTERKNELMKKSGLLEDINQLEKKFNSYKQLINNKDISAVINRFNRIAQDSSISIISLRPLIEEADSAYVKYPFRLTIEATDYHRIGRFIAILENSPDIYIIDDISISKRQRIGEMGKEEAKLIAELRLSTILVK